MYNKPPVGTVKWATRLAGTSSDNVNYITSDSSGNIYITGYYSSNPLTVYNSNGSTFGTLANAGSNDILVIKYNTTGTAQWAARLGAAGGDIGYGITSDSSGNIYITGSYTSNPLTIYNSDGSFFGTLANAGSNDVLVVKYNTTGTAQWATRLGGVGNDQGYRITSDSSGNIYISGVYTSNPLTVYNSDGSTFGTLANAGSNDILVVKYNTTGTAQWATRLGGVGNDQGWGITSDSSGNIYVTGTYASNPLTIYNSDGSTFGTLAAVGGSDVYVAKYNTTGTAQWATRLTGTGFDEGYDITSDSSGNIYITGSYTSTFTIYNSDGSIFGTLGSAGSNDVFVVKYNTTGTVQWATRLGGGATDQGYRIRSDSSGNIYVTGYYNSNPLIVYNSDGSTFGTTLAWSGGNDVFVVRYNTTGDAQWAMRFAGTGSEQGFGITSDSSGNIYVTGNYTSNPLTIYNSDGSTFGTLANAGSNDIFIVKI